MSTKLAVARIVSVRGLQGQVKIQLLTDFPELRLVPGAKFADLEIESYQRLNSRHYLKFKNINQREQAESLVGRTLTIDADSDKGSTSGQRPDLKVDGPADGPADAQTNLQAKLQAADQFRVVDLIGLQAVDLNGSELGRIVDVRLLPAQDQLVLEKHPGIGDPESKLARIPLVKQLVPKIDLFSGVVQLDLPEGLL